MTKTVTDAPPEGRKQARAKPRRKTFTALNLRKLKVPKEGQQLWWDTGTKGILGLSVLVSAGGTKTFRSTFYLNGERVDRRLGRVGQLDLAEARRLALEDRGKADKGIDPRPHKQDAAAAKGYEYVVDQFIEHYAKPRQRTWDQTARILKHNCKPFLKKEIDQITKQEVRALLRSFIAEGHPYKAAVTYAWLKKLWRWAFEEDYVTTPIMEGVRIEYDKRERNRVYSEDEIKKTWNAASKLDPVESAYIKLLILLVPRKTALACMKRSHLDDAETLWTTPWELTKSRKKVSKRERKYLTPLPPLAQRILKGLPNSGKDTLVFPGLPVHETAGGQPTFYGVPLKRKLVERGAPADFSYHAWRHTVATFLENAGYSEWERGLILNHAGSGVTTDYSHGHPLELKRDMLCKWADHVERLVQPQGATLLR
jgi:integrase